MAQFSQAVNSFLAGELSPRMRGRTELQQYQQGAEELYNQLVYVQGGAYRRPGSRYYNIANATDKGQYEGAAYIRAIPYSLSDGRRCAVFLYPGTLDTAFDIYDISDGTKQTTYRESTFNTELGTFTEAVLKEIQYAQLGDVLILVHRSFPPIYITPADEATYGADSLQIHRFDANTLPFLIDEYAGIYGRRPFQTLNIGNNQGHGSMTYANAPSIRLTCSTNYFTADMVGSYIKLSEAGTTVVVQIESILSATVANIIAVSGTPTLLVGYGVDAGTSWEQDAWNDYHGWPGTVCAFEQRVYFGGNYSFPDTVWASQIGDIAELMARRFEQDPDFNDALTNDRPYSFTIASTEASKIQWMAAGKTLQIGTLAREYVYSGTQGAMGPLDIQGGGESAYGSAYVQPVKYDAALYYVQRSGQSIRELIFNQDEDAYKGNNILVMAEHLIKKAAAAHATFSTPKIVQIAVQMTENPIMWVLDNNGGLLGGTIDRTNNIVAWSYHVMGGSLDGEIPKVVSLCIVPSADGESDNLLIGVKRTINGSTKCYFEIIGQEFALDSVFNSSTSLDDKLVYADSAVLVRGGSPATTFSGLDHLEGQTVGVIADGQYAGTYTVASGAITLASAKTEIVAGLVYTSRVKLLNIDSPTPLGSSQGHFVKVHALTLRFYRTLSAKFGRSLSDLEAITFDSATTLYDGDKRVTLHPGFDRNTSIYIVQENPLPMSVSCVIAEGQTNAA